VGSGAAGVRLPDVLDDVEAAAGSHRGKAGVMSAENSMTADPLWRELTERAAVFPRYSRVYGLCESCWLAATLLQPVGEPPGGRIWWATCQPCAVRWPSLVQGLSTALDPHDDPVEPLPPEVDAAVRAEFMYAAMLDLSRCHQLEPIARPAAAEETRPGGQHQMISDYELNTRSIAKFELFQFAEKLGWPALALNRVDVYPSSIAAGEQAWRTAPLAIPATRRIVWLALANLEQPIVPLTTRTRGEK
jgi:hypothetical protein